MYNNQIYFQVSESNVLASGAIGTQNYTYVPDYADPNLTKKQAEDAAKAKAQSKLYKLWGYGAEPEATENRQLLSAFMTEHRSSQIIMLESKVFDRREPEPEPEPPEPEPNAAE